MAIIALKAWYLEHYEPISDVIKRPQDLRLNRNSLLKSALRADFLDDSQQIRQSNWFNRYLEGETIEFYIEGSGGYAISNIDLISQEIYFTKQDITATLDPMIFFSPQTEYPEATGLIREVLEEAIAQLNRKSRFPLILAEAPRPSETPLRLSSSQLRQIRKSLLLVADGTAISTITGENGSQVLLNPNVCVELGYALQNKRSGQIILLSQDRDDLSGQIPFDLPHNQQLSFKNKAELQRILPDLIENLLQRFNLFF
jgi:hypothetical protein